MKSRRLLWGGLGAVGAAGHEAAGDELVHAASVGAAEGRPPFRWAKGGSAAPTPTSPLPRAA